MPASFEQAATVAPSSRVRYRMTDGAGFVIEFQLVPEPQPVGCFIFVYLFCIVAAFALFSYLGMFIATGVGLLWLIDVLTRGRKRKTLEVCDGELKFRSFRRSRSWRLDELHRAEMITIEGGPSGAAALLLHPKDAPAVELFRSPYTTDVEWIAQVLNRAIG